jgi:hypothetical protein
MSKNNVTQIKKTDQVKCFSYKVTMFVHIIADDEETAKAQLDEKGGIMTKRNVVLVNAVNLYGEKEDE